MGETVNFNKLDIKVKYKNLTANLVENFYLPILSNSVFYDRAVGYFTSESLTTMIKALKPFVLNNNGYIRLIISPYLTNNDLETIKNDINSKHNLVESIFEQFIQDEKSLKSVQLLMLLIKKKYLEIKIAVPKNKFGLFHEKIAIFTDSLGNQIATSGSNNETTNAIKHNFESFNTFCSWKEHQNEYVASHYNDFNLYWTNNETNLEVIKLEKAVSKNYLKKYDTEKSIEDLFGEINLENIEPSKLNFNPYPHQIEGSNRWMTTRNGILKYATGSGKTKTTVYILHQLRLEHQKLFHIIVVPDITLVNQWANEINSYGWNSLMCFSENPSWNKDLKDFINFYNIEKKYHVYIVASADTYFGEKFQRELSKIKDDYFLIVDECHTWGTENRLSRLPNPKYRLGLSATPELFFSENKTNRLLKFFGGIIHEYSLENAIKDNFLVGYEYYPIIVGLSGDEKAEYNEITKIIVKMIGRDVVEMKDGFDKALEMQLFKRARIVYGAESKLKYLEEHIEDLKQGGNLLIYAGPTSYLNSTSNEAPINLNFNEYDESTENISMTQIEAVNSILTKKHIPFAKYTSKENDKAKKFALKSFSKGTYSILTAIKCLDEGVDIPQVQKAVILASSTNPREFIQRRGRVLRKSEGKSKAQIYDFIVYEEEYPALLEKELKRLFEFARIALNKDSLFEKYGKWFREYLEGEENGK